MCENNMDFIKKNKLLIPIIVILVFLLIITAICLKGMFFGSNSLSAYGDRLKGIENVKLEQSKIDSVKDYIMSNKNCNSVTYNLSGKQVKFIIEVKEETDELSVESLLNGLLTKFSDDEKNFYDFQVFIINEKNGTELYPMLAYKHRNSDKFTISKKIGGTNEE